MSLLGQPSDPFDVLVIGSGATGGLAAKRLTERGMKVALLEAGRETVAADFAHHDGHQVGGFTPSPMQIAVARPIQVKCYACRAERHEWFVNDLENPYLQMEPYHWIRMRVLGGRLLAWAGHCYRMSDLDFKACRHDGYGEDWPISYKDLVSYYDEIECYLGVTGVPERLPQLPDGLYCPPAAINLTEAILRKSTVKTFDRVVTPARLAAMTCKTTPANTEGAWQRLHPLRGGSQFSSPWTALVDAANTGRLTLITDAVVAHVLMKDGRAVGVEYVDRNGCNSREVYGKCIILCASTLESTRILLNSAICNSSGTLGRYLMDHICGVAASGIVEVDKKRLLSPSHERHRVYIPRFRNVATQMTNSFIRGYGFQGNTEPITDSKYVDALPTTNARSTYATVTLASFGECLARKENFVEIDNERVDEWGIPILKVRATWSTNEIRLSRDAAEQAVEILEAAGVRDIRMEGKISVPGLCAHEIGTARMGIDHKTSVVNQFCQAHDVRNIFITDGACWVSSGCQNPTLTMMAITLRACDYIVHEAFKTF